MAEGTLQRETSAGKIKRNPDTGLLKRNSATDSSCCCGCQYCDDGAPTTMQLTFDGVLIRGCQNNSDPTGPDRDNCRYWYSADVTGVLDGTYCLAKSPDDPCCWCADIGTMELALYDAINCGGNLLIVEVDVFLRVCVTPTGLSVVAYFRMEHAFAFLNGPYQFGYLFSGLLTTATPCSVGGTVDNLIDGTFPFDFDNDAPNLYLADFGTCLVEPDAVGCAAEDAEVCGSLETQCPTDCSGCATTYSAVISGGGGGFGCATGTFPLTRSGCVWTDANGSQLSCSGGVWRLEILDAFGNCSRSMAEDDSGGCPPTTGWRGCQRCCASIQTVTVS